MSSSPKREVVFARRQSGEPFVLSELKKLGLVNRKTGRIPEEVSTVLLDIEIHGTRAGKHLKGTDGLYEAIFAAENLSLRLLFASQGGQPERLEILSIFAKKTQKTPRKEIEKAEKRRARWK